MAGTRAKFQLSWIRTFPNYGTELELTPVVGQDPESENKAFWEATPNGNIKLVVTNEDAVKVFTNAGLGAEFYVDFTPAK